MNIIEQAMVKFPKAKRIAVENATMGQELNMAFRMNVEMDRGLYNWNSHTMSAIYWVMKNKAKSIA
jgi:hypothetical protein